MEDSDIARRKLLGIGPGARRHDIEVKVIGTETKSSEHHGIGIGAERREPERLAVNRNAAATVNRRFLRHARQEKRGKENETDTPSSGHKDPNQPESCL